MYDEVRTLVEFLCGMQVEHLEAQCVLLFMAPAAASEI